MKRIARVLIDILQSMTETRYPNSIDLEFSNEYGEPGYDKEFPNSPILFSNWNYLDSKYESLVRQSSRFCRACRTELYGTRGHEYGVHACWGCGVSNRLRELPSLMRLIEKCINTEWSDEWLVSYETSKAYRCSGDSYDWKPYYIQTDDGEIIGGDEIEEDEGQKEWYVNEYLLNDPSRSCLFNIDLEGMGFVKVNENPFESGWHEGMNDTPEKALKDAREKFPNCDFVFSNLEPSQFYVEFDLYRREKEIEEEEAEQGD